MIELVPIELDSALNERFVGHTYCEEILAVFVPYYDKIGFEKPWIGYFAEQDGEIVGTGGIKGSPQNGKIEIGYGVVPEREGQGIGTQICHALVSLSRKIDENIIITAQTLPEENASCNILRKNGFIRSGEAWDEDEGVVWEWTRQP